jgi:hypothetical protein
MIPSFDEFYLRREAAIRFLRKSTKPWSASQDLDVEMEWEEERHPGFRALLEGIVAREERQEEEEDAEPEHPQPEQPHIGAIREAAVQFALDRGEVLQKVVVFTRAPNGAGKRVLINNP